MIKICEDCGKTFETENERVIICPKCFNKHRKQIIQNFIEENKNKDISKYFKVNDYIYINKKTYIAKFPYVSLDTDEENIFVKHFNQFKNTPEWNNDRDHYIYLDKNPTDFVEKTLSVYTEKITPQQLVQEMYNIDITTFLQENADKYKNDDLEYVLLNNKHIYKINHKTFNEKTKDIVNRIYNFLNELDYNPWYIC